MQEPECLATLLRSMAQLNIGAARAMQRAKWREQYSLGGETVADARGGSFAVSPMLVEQLGYRVLQLLDRFQPTHMANVLLSLADLLLVWVPEEEVLAVLLTWTGEHVAAFNNEAARKAVRGARPGSWGCGFVGDNIYDPFGATACWLDASPSFWLFSMAC